MIKKARNAGAMYKRSEGLRVVVGDLERSVEVKCLAADCLGACCLLIVKAQKLLVVLRMPPATEIATGTA